MGSRIPPWYGKGKEYYAKEIKKAKAKLEVKKLEVEELEEDIKILEEEIAKCED